MMITWEKHLADASADRSRERRTPREPCRNELEFRIQRSNNQYYSLNHWTDANLLPVKQIVGRLGYTTQILSYESMSSILTSYPSDNQRSSISDGSIRAQYRPCPFSRFSQCPGRSRSDDARRRDWSPPSAIGALVPGSMEPGMDPRSSGGFIEHRSLPLHELSMKGTTDKTTCGKEGIVPTQENNGVLLERLPES